MAKRATAKQLAARRKFVAAVRAGKFRKGRKSKTTTKRRKTRTRTRVITKVRRVRHMARRKTRRSSSKKSFKIPFLSNPTVKKVAAGVGMGTVLTTVLGLAGQGALAQNPAVKVIGGFAGGDLIGAAAALFLGGGLGSLTGGGNGNAQGGGMI